MKGVMLGWVIRLLSMVFRFCVGVLFVVILLFVSSMCFVVLCRVGSGVILLL